MPPDPLLHQMRRLFRPEGRERDSDAELLGRYVERRDEAAFAALVARHGPMVLGVCRRVLGSAADAEDAFQAIFLVLAKKADSVRPPGALAAWLYGVARRVASAARRSADRARRRRATPGAAAEAPDPRPDPLDALAARELLLILDEEVQRLPRAYRLPVVLCCLEGLSQEEAARWLGWTPGSLKGRLERGRARLRRRLARRGLLLSAALAASEVARAGVPPLPRLLPLAAGAGCAVCAGAAGGGVSPRAAAWAREALRGLAWARGKALAGLLLLAGALTAGAGVAALRHPAAPPAAAGEAPAPPAAAGRPGKVDLQGDALPPGAVARLGTVRWRHLREIHAVAYSRDGRLLATGGGHSVRLWDAASGRPRATLPAPEAVLAVNLSPDARLVAAGCLGKTFVVWETATGKERARVGGLENTVLSVAFSPDGKLLATNSYSAVRLWDAATLKEVRRWALPRAGARPLVFAQRGKTLAVGCEDHSVRRWEVATGRELPPLRGHTTPVTALAVTPDGRRLVSAGTDEGGLLREWDLDTGKERRRWRGPPGGSRALAFAPDGRLLAAGGARGLVVLYDAESGKERRRCRASASPPGAVTAVAFSPDGRVLAAGGCHKALCRWEVAGGKELPSPPGSQTDLVGVAVTPDGHTAVTASADGLLAFWDARGGKLLRSLRLSPAPHALALSADGRSLAVACGKEVRLWDAAGAKELGTLRGHTGGVDALAFSRDGRALASGGWQDHTIRLWDLPAGKERLKVDLPRPLGWNYGDLPLAFSPDGKVLYSGSADRGNPAFYAWDTATGKQRWRVARQVSSLALGPGGAWLVSSGQDGQARVWDTTTAGEVFSFPAGGVLALSPDGRTLATGGGDGVVRLWELATGRQRARRPGHLSGKWREGSYARGVTALGFSGDGRLLVSAAGDTTALVWDVAGPAGAKPPPARELEALWAALGGDDAARAYEAVLRLAAHPARAVPHLARRLRPVPAADPRRVGRLIRELDSEEFEARQRAGRELDALGDSARAACRRALAGPVSPEARRRLRRLLDGWEREATPPLRGDRLRAVRALEVLERAGTAEAWGLIARVAGGAEGAWLTGQAKAALAREPRARDGYHSDR